MPRGPGASGGRNPRGRTVLRQLQHQRLPLLRLARQQQQPNFEQHFGLRQDDDSEKPAFEVYRRAIARYGARPG
jgi:hypothetical protein